LDSDIPPPLDDKLKDNDFDLDDEEAVDDRNFELPELPTDYKVFGSVAIDENLAYSLPPPELSSFAFKTSPPDDLHFGTKSSVHSESPETCDVAIEKESEALSDVGVLKHRSSQDNIAVSDKKLDELSSFTSEGEMVHANVMTKSNDVSVGEKISIAAVLSDDVENIRCEENEKIVKDNLHSKDEQQDQANCDDTTPDDDEFDDFVEAAPIPTYYALSTEHTLKSRVDNTIAEYLADEKNVDENIPEPIPELNDDEDFNDFEAAIPVNRQVENVEKISQIEENDIQEVPFEADFSAFNAISDPVDSNSFKDFQDFKASSFDNQPLETQIEDDDDDFGDFSNFTQAPDPTTTKPAQHETLALNLIKPANVVEILNMMFPLTSTCSEEKPIALDANNVTEVQIIQSDTFVNRFNDFDSTLALRYQYSSSDTSQTLVKALGIDTRNIVRNLSLSRSF
jgi:Clathrin-binding box of Aftiphilin, vesicle trafficking